MCVCVCVYIYIYIYIVCMHIYPRMYKQTYICTQEKYRDFPGGTVVKNPPANAGDTGSSPGPGRSHVHWSN